MYDFVHLVSVRRLQALLDQGVPLRVIRSSVDSLRARRPEVEQPVSALRLWVAGSGRVVVRERGQLVEPEGQLVLDLEAGGDPGQVAPFERDRPRAESEAREEAEAWFDRGCKLDSDRATWSEAADAYLRALEADPNFADALCNLGTVFYNQDRKGKARECFERTVALEPGHVEGHLNLAALCEEQGRGESALRHYKLALAADPLCADTHVSLALLYQRLGLPGRARRHWRRYLGLEPAGAWSDVARRHLDD